MRFLSLDTSTKYTVIAIGQDKELLYGQSLLLDKSRLSSLKDLIKTGLSKAKFKINDVDVFGAGVGPGSFTGLRIGLSAIKGLSYALNKPCMVFSSLDAIAFNFKKIELCVAVDAKRSSIYASFYKKDGDGIKKFFGDSLMKKDAFLKKLSGSMVLCGDAVSVYKDDFVKRIGAGCDIAPEELWYPTVKSLHGLALQSIKNKKFVDSFNLCANYIYEEDCQVRK